MHVSLGKMLGPLGHIIRASNNRIVARESCPFPMDHCVGPGVPGETSEILDVPLHLEWGQRSSHTGQFLNFCVEITYSGLICCTV